MTCPDPLLGKSLVWSVDENIWLWRFWRSTTRFSRYQSIVLHFGCSCSPPSCFGIFWATFIYQQRKGRESGLTDPWVIHPLKDLELWGETIDGNSKQSGTNSKQQQRNWDSKKYRFETEIFCWGLEAGQDDSASRWALQELLSRTGAGLHHKKLFLWEEILARNVRNTFRWKTPLQRVFIVETCSLS